jgi:polar amino acid transport system permease protein
MSSGTLTRELTAGAWALSVIIALLVALGHETKARGTKWPILISLTAFRSVPQLVALYIFYFGLGTVLDIPPLVAGIAGLGLTEAAFNAEYLRAGLLTVTKEQRDAGASIGLSRLGVFRRVTLPQAIPYTVPPLLNSFVGLTKTATYASAVGVAEILYRGENVIAITGSVDTVILQIAGIYLVVTIPLTKLIQRYERHLRSRAAV